MIADGHPPTTLGAHLEGEEAENLMGSQEPGRARINAYRVSDSAFECV